MSRLDLDSLQRDGLDGQVPVRAPNDSKGFNWVSLGAASTGKGQKTAAFGLGPPSVQAVTVTVSDGQVQEDSVILASVGVPSSRTLDELELDPVSVHVGPITPGVGYQLVVVPANAGSSPNGNYIVNYARA